MVRKRRRKKRQPFEVGNSVAVKSGVKEVDLGYDMSGWQGRIVEIKEHPDYPPAVLVSWDSITLKNLPGDFIKNCELEGLSWSEYYLHFNDVEKTEPRDKETDVEKTHTEIAHQYAWLYLGKEGETINKVLSGVDPENDMACFEAWYAHLEQKLSFPFEAVVDEPQPRGPLQAGDLVRVIEMFDIKDPYGILVDIKKGRKHFVFPLCDLEVRQKNSPIFQPIKDYVIWYANR